MPDALSASLVRVSVVTLALAFITSLIVLLWLRHDNPGDRSVLPAYVEGVFFGVIPTMLFFGAAWFCLKKGLPFPATLTVSFAVWIAAALLHQLLLK